MMSRTTKKVSSKQPATGRRIRQKQVALVADPWLVMTDAVESGVRYGVGRADKYADDPLTDPQRARVENAVIDAVIYEMSEQFLWKDRYA